MVDIRALEVSGRPHFLRIYQYATHV
jgi:hypothetical protein